MSSSHESKNGGADIPLNFRGMRKFCETLESLRRQLLKGSSEKSLGSLQYCRLLALAMKHAGSAHNVSFPSSVENGIDIVDANALSGSNCDSVIKAFETYIDKMSLELLIYETVYSNLDTIILDANWKARASSYVSHIRDIVGKADVDEALRERIFKRINQLQEEIDRNRTKVESISELFLQITEAVGKGAKNLDPAVKLVERLAGALSGARSSRTESGQVPQLPSPDTLGLPPPE